MSGENDAIWQWYFDGKTCVEREPILDWEWKSTMIDAILEKKEVLPLLLGLHENLDELIHKRMVA